jgi:hypothetical protein
MKRLLLVFFAMACGSPSAEKVVETQSAKEPMRTGEAPAASTSDEDRSRLRQSFDDMQRTQNAYREARPEGGAGSGSGSAVKKTGPAVEAPKQ